MRKCLWRWSICSNRNLKCVAMAKIVLMLVIQATEVKVLWKLILFYCVYSWVTNLTLYLSTVLSDCSFLRKTHLTPIVFTLSGKSTNFQVLSLLNVFNSFFIVSVHCFASFEWMAWLKVGVLLFLLMRFMKFSKGMIGCDWAKRPPNRWCCCWFCCWLLYWLLYCWFCLWSGGWRWLLIISCRWC